MNSYHIKKDDELYFLGISNCHLTVTNNFFFFLFFCDEIIFIKTFSYRYSSFCLKNTIKIDMIKNNAKSFKVYSEFSRMTLYAILYRWLLDE